MTAQARSYPKAAYPNKVAIRHAVEAARKVGMDVAGYEVSPNGTIRVIDARVFQQDAKPSNDADELVRQLTAEGKL